MNEVGYIDDQYWNMYNLVVKDFNSLTILNKVALKDFQYKLNNSILGTQSYLYRI